MTRALRQQPRLVITTLVGGDDGRAYLRHLRCPVVWTADEVLRAEMQHQGERHPQPPASRVRCSQGALPTSVDGQDWPYVDEVADEGMRRVWGHGSSLLVQVLQSSVRWRSSADASTNKPSVQAMWKLNHRQTCLLLNMV